MDRAYETLWRQWDPGNFIPADPTLGTALTQRQVARGLGDKPALLWENAAGRQLAITYRQLDALTNRFASALTRLGTRPGDRVFLRLPNLPEFYVAALAAAKCGAVFIPSSTQFREKEISYRLHDAEAGAAITTHRLLPEIERVSSQSPTLRHVIVIAEDGEPAPGDTFDFARLVEQGSEAFVPVTTRNDDLAFIAYTSGTTGDPKGVAHFQR